MKFFLQTLRLFSTASRVQIPVSKAPQIPIIKRMKPLIIIYGSTGTGKSDLAVELATRFNGEVINADAMQMYKGLPIITNKITLREQKGIPHHLLGNIELGEDPWFVTRFKQEATRIISEIRSRDKLPILVGGSSYYIDGLLFDQRLVENQKTSEEGWTSNREELAAQHPVLNSSGEAMWAKLHEVDPAMADKWHPNDVRKIRTSLEIYFATGRTASEIYAEQKTKKRARSPYQDPSLGDVLIFWLYAHRDPLNTRLDKRVDKMVKNGLVDETSEVYEYLQSRLATGETVDRSKGIWQSIGFRQFEPYLQARKENPDDEANLAKLMAAGIDDTKTATRQYAKYQLRWMSTKTLTSLQEENLMDKLYLLDSSNLDTWHQEVLEKGVYIAEKFLTSKESLPAPISISEAAREVLAEALERSNRKDTPCRKYCEVCEKTLLTEELWQQHIKSTKHSKVVRAKRKRALIPADRVPSRALTKVDDDDSNLEPETKTQKIEDENLQEQNLEGK
ncbi:tRNA dimethylallyltransferase, mitochondrial [Podospora pseudopauciseta]|uniref:tRNA dimethylallyltransferase n=1 Tax=Podospora pseudopauciseta TaxID=2093780 RepID=A0ABR0HPF9_9PEZI|nr:tRNA dimethylallyltransferase, mitochondrial [Podospora pseudopauciseta]